MIDCSYNNMTFWNDIILDNYFLFYIYRIVNRIGIAISNKYYT